MHEVWGLLEVPRDQGQGAMIMVGAERQKKK